MQKVHHLLGILSERSVHTARAVDRIEARQIGIETTMQRVEERVSVLETKIEHVPRLERLIKQVLAYGAPVVTLWMTGSLDKAVEVARLLSSR